MIKFLLILLLISSLSAEEMIIGKEIIKPGIDVTFEAAPKDTIHPKGMHLKENVTDKVLRLRDIVLHKFK